MEPGTGEIILHAVFSEYPRHKAIKDIIKKVGAEVAGLTLTKSDLEVCATIRLVLAAREQLAEVFDAVFRIPGANNVHGKLSKGYEEEIILCGGEPEKGIFIHIEEFFSKREEIILGYKIELLPQAPDKDVKRITIVTQEKMSEIIACELQFHLEEETGARECFY